MLRFAWPIARYTLLEATRNRLVWLLGVAAVLALGASAFLRQVAITDAAEIQGSVIAAMMRLFAVFLVASSVVTSMVREFNDKILEVVLAKPLARASYFFGKLGGFLALAAIVAVAVSLPLAVAVPPERIPAWTFSLFCELAVVASAALFCVLTLNQVVTALAAVFGFYLLGRSMAAIQIIASGAVATPSWSDRVTSAIIDGIATLLPSFDRMTDSGWLLGAAPAADTIGRIAAQCVIYVALLAGAALFDLYRQNF